jgi:hypothetical protein
MNDLFLQWAVGCLVAASIMMWWFNTSIGVHILEIIRWVGVKKKNAYFWSVPVDGDLRNDLADFTKADFDDWLFDKLHSKLAELLTCPGCFSAHVSFWVALASQVITQTCSLELFLASWLGWPVLVNILLNLTHVNLSRKGAIKAFSLSASGQLDRASAISTETKTQEASTKQVVAVVPSKQQDESSKAASLEASHSMLRSRGIQFHTDDTGAIIIDYMPKREVIISAFLDGEKCPAEIPECDMLKAQMNAEISEKGGAKCTSCEKNKIRNKYRQILSNILKHMPELD